MYMSACVCPTPGDNSPRPAERIRNGSPPTLGPLKDFLREVGMVVSHERAAFILVFTLERRRPRTAGWVCVDLGMA